MWDNEELTPEQECERNDRHLAAAAQLLYERGDLKVAALLIDVSGLRYVWERDYQLIDERGFDAGTSSGEVAHLDCEPYLVSRFGTDDLEAVRWALDYAIRRDIAQDVIDVKLIPVVNDPEWRARLSAAFASGPTNQARIAPLDPNAPKRDRMQFRSMAEVKVYDALKKRQDRRPGTQTLGIAALPMLNVPSSTWEPDLMVTLNGRVGVIEVDGPHHRGMDKRAAERSRDRLLEDAGVALIDHIDAVDTDDPMAVDAFVGRFLNRLRDK